MAFLELAPFAVLLAGALLALAGVECLALAQRQRTLKTGFRWFALSLPTLVTGMFLLYSALPEVIGIG